MTILVQLTQFVKFLFSECAVGKSPFLLPHYQFLRQCDDKSLKRDRRPADLAVFHRRLSFSENP